MARNALAHKLHRPDDTFSLRDQLNGERLGGILLLTAAAIGFALANSPLSEWFSDLAHTEIGPEALGLKLSLAHWAADGVLAIFFFVVGLELKREFVTGSLRDPRKVSLPILAAVAGMAVPAVIYSIVVSVAGLDAALRGWAIPVATDIAFAMGLVVVLGRGMPPAFRVFLLTLAVVDDLLGITVIAIFYTANLSLIWLAAALAVIAAYWFVTHRGWNPRWLLIPLGVLAWYCMLQSGVHATIAGVLLGLSVPARPIGNDEISLAEDMEHDWNALSQGVALPVFAFFSAGVPVAAGGGDLSSVVSDPVFLGVLLGLFAGKPLGIFASVAIFRWVPGFALDASLKLRDILALGGLAGIGFTVSLLIGELAFRGDETHIDHAHLGVIAGSLLAALAGGMLLSWCSAAHRRSHDAGLEDEQGASS
ncbi:Na+/H+ antiporter NhaA [Pseudoclavibacter alba]|uniref:Na(+)/H(+) antiporter NhaA n=1 Tax=Pseudoclavibacter albus TaxID=272241 RepID=A0ABT2HVN9_9MICO|nr:Na+/H+ antiporter NhaA [Pseudoclavibacter alba]MCT2042371.1 Na+/H+ antiporter NhaA [Pseudoclavibacter alba]